MAILKDGYYQPECGVDFETISAITKSALEDALIDVDKCKLFDEDRLWIRVFPAFVEYTLRLFNKAPKQLNK